MTAPVRKPMQAGAPRLPSTADFESALLQMFAAAGAAGESFLDVTANTLSKRVNGKGDHNKARGVCCNLMRRMMIPGDHEISVGFAAPASALLIRYRLPR